jgi:serine/threonine-protein kinase
MIDFQLSGNLFGQYELRELVGKGGMGVVYRAYQPSLGREVAIKLLSDLYLPTANDLKRFQAEAKTAATLEHPHIVPVYDYGTFRGINFVVMRLLTGGSLAQRIAARRIPVYSPLPLDEIAQMTLQLASALDYAHLKGVIHRDVKPANILFDDHDVPYLVDFGVAKVVVSTTSLTSTDDIVGTLPYISPDQLRNAKITPAADQYALAVTVYMMLTGHLPHEANTPYALMQKRLNEPPKPLRAYRRDLPKAVSNVMNRALAREPSKRYETVSAFARALYEALGAASYKPPTLSNPNAPKNYLSEPSSESPSDESAVTADKPDAISLPPARRASPARRFKILLLLITLFLIILSGWLVLQPILLGTLQAAATEARCSVRLTERAYIRSGPGIDFEFIRAYDAGWTTNVVGRATDPEDNLWWNIEVPSLDNTYWVADAVTEESGDCSVVPLLP